VSGGLWEVGAGITFPFPPEVIDMTLTGEVLEVDEPKVLAFSWGDEKLRFELSPEGEGTHLVLIDELPAGAAARNAAGWEVCLDRLVGLDPSPDAWRPRFEAYAAAFEPALGPQEGPPAGYKGGKPERSPRRADQGVSASPLKPSPRPTTLECGRPRRTARRACACL
jgi:Activator of Hsp90 ATPase homolog 1-like protein